ncbi:hypothetical protein CCR94_22605 [Rhodoblastus sphagnicola]|uniref:Uncharacterized protein n=1 Tax=Rhodoblastus sphagnicola TaxID=333368 RepID=A0A2S6MVM7_9HYPH|nr:hypothetical protein [Rhodoblastus sphagnicola]MBB4198359.1 hypothetical protein [Rhodoblastus sphagnicola]PPQ26425.1 hypothetical protein CCR94_22605 [Rhodoblastus sphagnicola]
MEKHLERALIEIYYAMAEFEQAKAGGRWPEAETAETLFVSLRLSRWGLETALRSLHEIDGAAARRQNGHQND